MPVVICTNSYMILVLFFSMIYFNLVFFMKRIRILPHHQDTGGFFIAVLEKKQRLPWMKVYNDGKSYNIHSFVLFFIITGLLFKIIFSLPKCLRYFLYISCR